MSSIRIYTEELILGACLIENSAFLRVNKILNASNFTNQNIFIWEAIEELLLRKQPIDILTVSKKIMETNTENNNDQVFKRVSIHLMELTQRVCSTANLEYHALVLIELHLKDSLKQLSFIYKKQAAMNLQFAEDMGELFNMLMPADCDPLELLFNTVSYLRINYPNESELYQSILDLANDFTKQAIVVRRELGEEKKVEEKVIVNPKIVLQEDWPLMPTRTKNMAIALEKEMQLAEQETLIFELNS